MDRREKEFLTGFRRAAQLAECLLASPPKHTDAAAYLEEVADLHGRSEDLVRRGLAVGCLSALGRT